MSERDRCIQSVKGDLKQKLGSEIANVSNAEYKKVLRDLIIQGMIKLLEDEVVIRARKEDQSYIQGILSDCEAHFAKYMREQTGREYTTKLILDKEKLLTEADGGALGGVILSSKDRKIVCINTMQSRLNQVFEELLPEIRRALFPTK